MRLTVMLIGLTVSGSAAAQTKTRCIRQIDGSVDCATTPTTPALNGYAEALGYAQGIMPDYQEQERARQQTKQLQLQNQLLQRQLELQAAPGYNLKECRRSAKAAIEVDDLALARDVLNACAASR